jgi:hypothetical protein
MPDELPQQFGEISTDSSVGLDSKDLLIHRQAHFVSLATLFGSTTAL